jgi:hypothetical protein
MQTTFSALDVEKIEAEHAREEERLRKTAFLIALGRRTKAD